MHVELLRWPSQRQRRDQLDSARRPRLLLVEADAPAPVSVDPLEDWVRLPAERHDVDARIEALSARCAHDPARSVFVDDFGVCRFDGRHLPLPPIEARLLSALGVCFGSVVSRAELFEAGWPGAEPGRNALDVHILRLRRRIEPLGLSIRTVRSRGYLLDAERPAAHESS